MAKEVNAFRIIEWISELKPSRSRVPGKTDVIQLFPSIDKFRELFFKEKPSARPLFCLKPMSGCPKAILYYLSDAFRNHESVQSSYHSNRAMARFFSQELMDRGFEVWIGDYAEASMPDFVPDFVFGQGVGYFRALRTLKSRQNVFVYLGAGMHPAEAYRIECAALARFERVHGVACRRYLQTTAPDVLGDAVIAIGNSELPELYHQRGNRDVFLIPNIVLPGIRDGSTKKDFETARTNFAWMAAYGPVLRGLDLAYEAFRREPNLTLWVCGDFTFEREFDTVCRRGIVPPNVRKMGWVDVGGDRFCQVVNECGFLLYPSHTDSMPGSVVNLMAAGLVPIVSRSSFVSIGASGRTLGTVSVDAIHDAIRWGRSIAASDLAQMALVARETCLSTYSFEAFVGRVKLAFDSILNNRNSL